jgi:hypothetical protein
MSGFRPFHFDSPGAVCIAAGGNGRRFHLHWEPAVERLFVRRMGGLECRNSRLGPLRICGRTSRHSAMRLSPKGLDMLASQGHKINWAWVNDVETTCGLSVTPMPDHPAVFLENPK